MPKPATRATSGTAVSLFVSLLISSAVAMADRREDPSEYVAWQTLDELSWLSFEEFLTVRVRTVSKRSEDIREAPGIATVGTAEDIRRYGANDLRDALRRVPNLLPLSSGSFREMSSSLHGQHSVSQKRHLLILFNERPMQDASFGPNRNILPLFLRDWT